MPNVIKINYENMDKYFSSSGGHSSSIARFTSDESGSTLNNTDEHTHFQDEDSHDERRETETETETESSSINSDFIDKSTPINQEALNDQAAKLSQWVSNIKEIRSSNRALNTGLTFLNDILGPISSEELTKYLTNDEEIETLLDKTNYKDKLTQIIFTINEKVFIDEINIYERLFIKDSFIMRIEAFNEKLKKSKVNKNSDTGDWLVVWDSKFEADDEEISDEKAVRQRRIFTPKIRPTPFGTNSIRVTLSGSLCLINAIEIKGNKIAVDDDETTKPNQNEQAQEKANENSQCYPSEFKELVSNGHLFADVYFEVDGKVIPAHRNILSFRSAYFRAMFSSNSSFKESVQLTQNKPIYLKDIRYDIFVELLNYIYTGHISCAQISHLDLIDLVKLADAMNLIELQQLCLFHFSQLLDEHNVIEIYKETREISQQIAFVNNNTLKVLLDLCYDLITENFPNLCRTKEFCSLSQELMINLIQTVLPRIAQANANKNDL